MIFNIYFYSIAFLEVIKIFLNMPIYKNQSNNLFTKNFLFELQKHIAKINSSNILSNLYVHSLITFAKYDGNFAVCFDYNSKKIYYVPLSKITGNKPKPGEALKVCADGTFYVDYTAILAEENKIEGYLQECTIAK